MTATRSSPPQEALHLRPLQQLQRQGFDLAVLLGMERDALLRAHRAMELAGLPITKQSLVEAATRDLPRDSRLLLAYTEANAMLASRPVRELESIADMLAQAAHSLESLAVQHLARGDDAFRAERALAHHAIGERLADLMQGAETLARSGMVATPSHASRLQSVQDFIHSGPLSRFIAKASALLAERAQNSAAAPRLAMAG